MVGGKRREIGQSGGETREFSKAAVSDSGSQNGRGTEKRNESHVGPRGRDREAFKGVIRIRCFVEHARDRDVGIGCVNCE